MESCIHFRSRNGTKLIVPNLERPCLGSRPDLLDAGSIKGALLAGGVLGNLNLGPILQLIRVAEKNVGNI